MAKKASLAIKKGSLAKKASLANKTPSPKQKAVKSRPRQKPRLCFSAEAVEGAANTIAKHIAEAEHKFFIAAEAIKESERVARMAEDCDAVVMHLKEILEQCKSSLSLFLQPAIFVFICGTVVGCLSPLLFLVISGKDEADILHKS